MAAPISAAKRRGSVTFRLKILLLCLLMVFTALWNWHGSLILDLEEAEAEVRASFLATSEMLVTWSLILRRWLYFFSFRVLKRGGGGAKRRTGRRQR